MSATVNVSPRHRRLQETLKNMRIQFDIAFSVAQEMAACGPQPVLADPIKQNLYGEELLNIANCLCQLAEMREEAAQQPQETAFDPLPLHHSLLSARRPGGGTQEEEYHRVRKL